MFSFVEVINESRQEILEALKHLKYSYEKTDGLSADIKSLSSEDLEKWEGLVARFGRVSDIFISKYIRAKVMEGDPGFRGTVRDFLDQAEKMGLIDSADLWLGIREQRNLSVHEYSSKKALLILKSVRELTPHLLKLEEKV